jgi:hypothetical protein
MRVDGRREFAALDRRQIFLLPHVAHFRCRSVLPPDRIQADRNGGTGAAQVGQRHGEVSVREVAHPNLPPPPPLWFIWLLPFALQFCLKKWCAWWRGHGRRVCCQEGGGGDRGGEQPTGRPLTSPGVWGTCAGAPPHSQRWSLGPLRPPHCVVTPLQLNTPVRSGRSGAVLVSWAERCGQLGGAQPLSVERGAATVSWAGRPFVCSPRQPSPTHMTAVSLAEQP